MPVPHRTLRFSAAQVFVGGIALSGVIQRGPQVSYGAIYKKNAFAREHTKSTAAPWSGAHAIKNKKRIRGPPRRARGNATRRSKPTEGEGTTVASPPHPPPCFLAPCRHGVTGLPRARRLR